MDLKKILGRLLNVFTWLRIGSLLGAHVNSVMVLRVS
jgi:hypothetical protein